MADPFRVYAVAGKKGYPPEWDAEIKHLVREQAGHRCVRCGHPYLKGMGEWSPCDEHCTHEGPFRVRAVVDGNRPVADISVRWEEVGDTVRLKADSPGVIEAQWRILTVHHLNGVKLDCRWWNLASLCQRCHLRIQRTVVLPRVFPWEHTEWFKPYAAGWYAFAYLGEELTRDETMARLDELLNLERLTPV